MGGTGEFTSKEFKDFCDQQGIRRLLTPSYTPQQNTIMERKNCTYEEEAKRKLLDSSIMGRSDENLCLCPKSSFHKTY